MQRVAAATLAADLGRSLCSIPRPLPEAVLREAERSLLNVLGTAIGASQQPAVGAVVALAVRLGASGRCPIPGRSERVDAHHAALATGVAAHLDDFDDTHLATVIHPAAVCLAALLPLAAEGGGDGGRLLASFALGIEAELRIGRAMSPSHYDEGWHITGTVGAVAAAASAGLFLGLDAERLAAAIAIAAAHPLGHRESFGTMEKSFHPGKAAAWGLFSVRLAAEGRPADLAVFDGPDGYFGLLAARSQPATVLEGWGKSWEILQNTYKPYPCGIVAHPAIDAAVALAARLRPEQIGHVEIHCNPLVPELMGNPAPGDGLQARFSTIHSVAAGLADGRVGLQQYEDGRVNAPDLVRLRALCALLPEESIARDAASVTVRLEDGSVLEESVEHARGSLERPLTDAELLEKVEGLVEPDLPGRTAALAAAVRGLGSEDGLRRLLEAAVQ